MPGTTHGDPLIRRAAAHTQAFRLRFDECGRDGAARSATVLRYVVETAFGHSAAVGYPLSWYFSHGLFWLVRQARLRLDLPVGYPAALAVTTRVVGARRIWARRENTVRNRAGVHIGAVTMDWILTDRQGRPARVPAAMAAAFAAAPSRIPLERYAPETAPPDAPSAPYHVPPHQTDPRGHVNNAAYLDLLDDALDSLGLDPQVRPVEYELAYLQPAASGDVLQCTAWAAAETGRVVVRRPDGAVVWWGRRRPLAVPP